MDRQSYRAAIIDLGSNTARLIVLQTVPGYAYRLVDEIREVVRLQKGMTKKGHSQTDMFSTLVVEAPKPAKFARVNSIVGNPSHWVHLPSPSASSKTTPDHTQLPLRPNRTPPLDIPQYADLQYHHTPQYQSYSHPSYLPFPNILCLPTLNRNIRLETCPRLPSASLQLLISRLFQFPSPTFDF